MPDDDLRALDRQLAEAMGWRAADLFGTGNAWKLQDSKGAWVRPPSRDIHYSFSSAEVAWRCGCPPFSADTAEGWGNMKVVVERMAEIDPTFLFERRKRATGEIIYCASFWGNVFHSAPSLPAAVCKAAIAALGEGDA